MLNQEELWEEELLRIAGRRKRREGLLKNAPRPALSRPPRPEMEKAATGDPPTPAALHRLWPEIEKVVEEQVRRARAEPGISWQPFFKDGPMELFRRQESVNGAALEPLRAVHVVKGVTGREACHYFFGPQFRHEWETTLERMEVVEDIADDTLLFHQVHRKVWPTSQRDSVFWSHMRRLRGPEEDCWAVVNYSTEHPDHPANVGQCVRIFLIACLLGQTVVSSPEEGEAVSRDHLACHLTYSSVVNPGGRTPMSIVRALSRREYPKFLKKFTDYIQRKTRDKPIMY